MNIEEKAKAYDEAIERAKKWYNAPNVDKIPTFANRVIDEIFPELKESEDERIRKELISHFCGIRDNCGKDWHGFNINDVIAWLEKQGEQKPAWSEGDEHLFENCLYAIETFKEVDNPHRVVTINWLKSLKDRVQPKQEWKPLGKHLEALAIAINNESLAISVRNDLNELLEQLKQL